MTDIKTVSWIDLFRLKEEALASPAKRSRLALHDLHTDGVQEMVICLHRDSYIRAHRHPAGKAESYHVLEGSLEALIYTDGGLLRASVRLDAETPLYRLAGGIYHAPRAVSEWAIYHECYPGPWTKEADVEYAAWSPEEIE